MLDLDLIRIDGETQTRVELDQDTVDAYADAYLAGAAFPPVTVFYDGKDRWLADGFHRYFAAKKAGKKTILESITPGTKRDAILFSLGANGKHGKPPSNADKRNAVERMLRDPEWSAWSQEKIAKTCHVSGFLVSKMVHERASLSEKEIKPATRTVERNGKTYEQNTANIGRVAAPIPQLPPVVEPDAEEPPDYTELDATKDALSVISEENDRLNDRLAIAAFEATEEERSAAHETLVALRAENKTLSATLRAVTLSRDSLMEENAQMKRQMAMQRKEIDKLKNNK